MDRPLHERWEAEAGAWARWVRTPGHDEWHRRLNWPAFLALLPGPGRLTLDLGCGEGRGGVALRERGHRVIGVDAAPTLAGLARETGAYEEVHLADAVALPLDDGAVDLVVAYMSLHDMDDARRRAARGGARARARRPAVRGDRPSAVSARLGSDDEIPYFEERRYTDVVERDGLGWPSTASTARSRTTPRRCAPRGWCSRNCASPRPTDADVSAVADLAKARRRPPFLHLLALRP